MQAATALQRCFTTMSPMFMSPAEGFASVNGAGTAEAPCAFDKVVLAQLADSLLPPLEQEQGPQHPVAQLAFAPGPAADSVLQPLRSLVLGTFVKSSLLDSTKRSAVSQRAAVNAMRFLEVCPLSCLPASGSPRHCVGTFCRVHLACFDVSMQHLMSCVLLMCLPYLARSMHPPAGARILLQVTGCCRRNVATAAANTAGGVGA